MTGRRKLIRRRGSSTLGDLSPFLARLLSSRGVSDISEVDHSLARLLPPDTLKDIDKAAAIIAEAIVQQRRILIVGDFDADGATSTALLTSGFTAMGATGVQYLVPDRFRYGYGLSPEIVAEALQLQPNLIVTVDNGISSIDGVAMARAHGIDVVVTDHHLAADQLPDASAIVNPNQPGCPFPAKSTAGVGIAFYVLSRVRQVLATLGRSVDVNLADYLDLVALGTVADVVPLEQNNRILVAEGLRRIAGGRARPGIVALIESCGLDPAALTSRDLAFSLGPRLNAAGRLENMTLGIECLLADSATAPARAQLLQSLNSERRQIEAEMRADAMQSLQLDVKTEATGVCLFEPHWHEGVVGIIASRIKDRMHRPAIAFAPSQTEGELKGSGRSIPGFHIRDALDAIAASHPGMIVKFGGHAMAAGLTLAEENYEQFAQLFDELAKNAISAADLEHRIVSDGELNEFSVGNTQALLRAAPWGQGFAEPMFDGEFEVIEQRIVGGSHLKLRVRPITDNQIIDAIAFGHDRLLDGHYHVFCYRPDVNRYRGRETLQLIIECIDPILPDGRVS